MATVASILIVTTLATFLFTNEQVTTPIKAKIIENKGDYIIGLKKNQHQLYKDIDNKGKLTIILYASCPLKRGNKFIII